MLGKNIELDIIYLAFIYIPFFKTRLKSTWEIMNAYSGNETICLGKLSSIKIKIVLTHVGGWS